MPLWAPSAVENDLGAGGERDRGAHGTPLSVVPSAKQRGKVLLAATPTGVVVAFDAVLGLVQRQVFVVLAAVAVARRAGDAVSPTVATVWWDKEPWDASVATRILRSVERPTDGR
jgi:hypothetical protein